METAVFNVEHAGLDEMFRFLNQNQGSETAAYNDRCVAEFLSGLDVSTSDFSQSHVPLPLSGEEVAIDETFFDLDAAVSNVEASPESVSNWSRLLSSPHPSDQQCLDYEHSPSSFDDSASIFTTNLSPYSVNDNVYVMPYSVFGVPVPETSAPSSDSETYMNSPTSIVPDNDSAKQGRWTPEEDRILRDVVASYKGNWKKIAQFIPGRTAQQCLHRWRKSVQPGITRKRWTDAEDQMLRDAVASLGSVWTKVQKLVPGRTDVQCRERWVNILDPNICRADWTKEEDDILRNSVKELGVGKWSLISTRMPRRRTDYGCRKRWEKLVRAGTAHV